MLKLTKCVLVLSVGFALGAATAPAFSADPLVIGFSQAASNSAHRNTMTKRNQSYATENYKDAKLIVTNAEGKSAKQISDIESLQVQGMKVLMISAQDSAAITPTIKQLMAAGIECSAPEGLADALVLAESTDVSRLPGYADGLFSVQDGAAQRVADLLDLESLGLLIKTRIGNAYLFSAAPNIHEKIERLA